ncbi:uncharacterized protein B0J16DRAFT_385654 [Fusarium flagelliforme]|uniref:Uncharacterized protein n=1 Tax=Fusarium flagelliforme TaxID=2675880 RepID=A0A395N3F1_9HYPO|nr:uncharacterized protein B0J16DRAFT_385654 [Fusarium flagelliforme]KAH7182579.1 hypothetical protein B0J16DRAFT_385654 [Fusarium flagelliforme]RFN54664.1 hypothetical protein FIE12Z_1009 [Fusarium flagelliforme]
MPSRQPIRNDEDFKARFRDFIDHVYHEWTFSDPIILPTLVPHTFAQSSLHFGRLMQDIPVCPGSVISNNRKKGAKAYLMIKRDEEDNIGFLWCDADGKALKKVYIKKSRGMTVSKAKADLVETYNEVEDVNIMEHNKAMMVANARKAIVKCAEQGLECPTPEDLYKDHMMKMCVFADVSDPELN